jgi:hypothetical protein
MKAENQNKNTTVCPVHRSRTIEFCLISCVPETCVSLSNWKRFLLNTFFSKKNSRKDCICLSKKRLLVKISNIRIKNGKPFLTKQCGKGLLWSAHAQFIHIGSRLLLDNTDYFDMQGVYVRWTWMYNTVMITYIQILIKNI